MKIAHALGWYFPESVGGTEVYVAALCRRLRACDHDVAVVAPDPRVRAEHRYEHDGVPVVRYPIPAQPTREEAQGVQPVRGADVLTRWLNDWRPDVFHVHSVTTGLGRHEMSAARHVGARTVLTHHLPSLGYICRRGTLMRLGRFPCDGVAEQMKCAACVLDALGAPRVAASVVSRLPAEISRAFGVLPGKLGTALGLPSSILDNQSMQRDLVAATDRMVALNESARSMLILNGAPPEKVIINRLGHSYLSVRRKPAAPTRTPIRLGFLGRLHPNKGVYELARAIRLLPRAAPFTLEIRGVIQSDVEKRVRDDLVELVGRDPRVIIGADVGRDEVLKVLAAYDVLCCPSTWFENGPTVAIEAIAVGTPVIGTRLGNLAELIEDRETGRLVEAGDAEDLARAIAEVVASPAIVDRWRSKLPSARTMDDITGDYVQLYEELCGARVAAVS